MTSYILILLSLLASTSSLPVRLTELKHGIGSSIQVTQETTQPSTNTQSTNPVSNLSDMLRSKADFLGTQSAALGHQMEDLEKEMEAQLEKMEEKLHKEERKEETLRDILLGHRLVEPWDVSPPHRDHGDQLVTQSQDTV